MIGHDSVVATENGFVTVDKVNASQFVRAMGNKLTMLEYVADTKTFGLMVETEHFGVVCSYNQRFVVDETHYKHASDLKTGDTVLTSEGFQPVIRILRLDGSHGMSNVITKARVFQANCFVLLTD